MARPNLKAVDNVSTQPQRSPEREALHRALAARDDAQRRVTAIRQAQEQALSQARTARDTLERAEAGVQVAKTQAARHLVDSALGKAGPTPVTLREARQAVQDARDDVEAAEAAQADLEQQLKAAESKFNLARVVFDRAYREALSADPAVNSLLDEKEALTAKLLDIDAALCILAGAGGVPHAGVVTLEVQNHVKVCELAQQWRTAIDALEQDADAVMPVVPD